MNEWIMNLINELEKKLNQSNAQMIGTAMGQRTWSEKQRTNKVHRSSMEESANDFSSKIPQMKEAIKGRFADKLTEELGKQEKALTNFL